MLRPILRMKSRKQLKIDQYKIKVHKRDEDPSQPFVAKSILLHQDRAGCSNHKRQPNKKVAFITEDYATHCHCTREERHRTAEKIRMGFKMKRSFTTHKYFQSKKTINKEEDLTEKSQDLITNGLQKMTGAIIQAMKKNGTIVVLNQNRMEIQSQSLSKLIKYFLSLSRGRNRNKHDSESEVKKQFSFMKQVHQIVNNQVVLRSQNEYYYKDRFKGDFNLEVQKRNKQNILCDMEKKIEAKTAEIAEMQQSISRSRALMQKINNKKVVIRQSGIFKNEQYIRQLCQEYNKHWEDINSYSVIIQTWQSKNNVKIGQNVEEQFIMINQFLSQDRTSKIQLGFVRDFLARVMQQLKVKYTQLQRLVQQKTQWITQLLQKNKKQAQFNSFKQQFLQNLRNQFCLNFLESEEKLKMLKKKIQAPGSQSSNVDAPVIIEQIQSFLIRMNQNYLLNNSFH